MALIRRRIGGAWGSVRSVLHDFSFDWIKDIVGRAGFPIHELGHLQQRSSGGATKGQLLGEIDRKILELSEEDLDRFVTYCIAEMLRGRPGIAPDLEQVLNRVGWGISGAEPFPLELQIDIDTGNLSDSAQQALSTCVRRYRDGDIAGAMTSICGMVDGLTERIYQSNPAWNHRDDSYQERVSKSFNSLEGNFKQPFSQAGLDNAEIDRLWHNQRGSINQAVYVLGSFRRAFSDVHGRQWAPRELVQRALDCAVFIIRSIVVV